MLVFNKQTFYSSQLNISPWALWSDCNPLSNVKWHVSPTRFIFSSTCTHPQTSTRPRICSSLLDLFGGDWSEACCDEKCRNLAVGYHVGPKPVFSLLCSYVNRYYAFMPDHVGRPIEMRAAEVGVQSLVHGTGSFTCTFRTASAYFQNCLTHSHACFLSLICHKIFHKFFLNHWIVPL